MFEQEFRNCNEASRFTSWQFVKKVTF